MKIIPTGLAIIWREMNLYRRLSSLERAQQQKELSSIVQSEQNKGTIEGYDYFRLAPVHLEY